MSFVKLQHITKRFGNVIAVNDLSIEIEKGECFSMLGPSGCGKTTTLRMIAGFEDLDEGEISVGGKLFSSSFKKYYLPPEKRHFGMVFQAFAVWPHLNVFNNVAFPLQIRGFSRSEIAEKTRNAMMYTGLSKYENTYPNELSGGQKQRIALARAIAINPDVMLLDEPLSNLDPKLREEMRFEIKELVTQLHMTAVYVTHDQGEALALSDRVAVMSAGRIQQIGTPRDIFEQPNSLFVADFIGLSDFIKAHVEALEGGSAWLAVKGLRVRVETAQPLRAGQDVTLFIRPTRVELLDPGAPAGENVLEARVLKLTYLGDNIDYRVVLPGDWEIRVQTNGQQYIPAGSAIKVRLPSKHCHIIAEQ
jgi:iron(III) transport system ATP-binding protein